MWRDKETSHSQKLYLSDKEEIDAAIAEVLAGGNWVMGPQVNAFEEEFAAYCESKFSVAVTSGTSSLLMALLAVDAGPGDEILTVANGDLAISLAVLLTGASLKWVDVEPRTSNMDPDRLEEMITSNTKAVIVAHMYGLPADMDRFQAVLSPYPHIYLIEDASLATGALYKGRKVGSIGDIGCFSLAPGKILTVLGSGGALTTNSSELYVRINQARHYGRAETPYHFSDPLPPLEGPTGMVMRGLNERMDTLQCAVGRVKLRHLEEDLSKRRTMADIYRHVLEDTAAVLQECPNGVLGSYRSFAFYVDPVCRDAILDGLREQGVMASAYYTPDHYNPYFRKRGFGPGHLPVTESTYESVICLPCQPHTPAEESWRTALIVREEVLRHIG